jgi:hypothetical protein
MRIAFAIVVIAAVVVVGNAVARPGCSLLPVELPTNPDRSSPGTPTQACAALGRPMPEVRYLPLGLRESELGIDGPPPFGDVPRQVQVSYAIGSVPLALLGSQRGSQIPPGNAAEVNGSVNGSPAIIDEHTYPAQGSAPQVTMVFYLWTHGGLLHSLRVRLDQGITREMADRMAASVR